MNKDAKSTDIKVSKNKGISKLEQLKKQKAVIEARIQATEARLKNSTRKQDTRRKILVGSYYLDKAIKENTMENLKMQMYGYLTRDSDKKLFGFSEKHTDENAKHVKDEKINPPKALAEES